MAEELIKTVQDMLKEETWTRAAIGNYTKEKIVELAGIVEKARNENCIDELYAICEEQLSHSKDSIIALYISGIISLQKGTLDNTPLVTLVDIFQKNHKESVVEYLCTSILEDDPNNKFALRTLAEFYRADGNPKVWELYTQIVKIDFEEADLAKALAEHYEAEGDAENSTEYYKKAILRFVTAGNLNAVKEIWTKLVQLIPQEIDFFQLVKRKIAKTLGEDKTAILLQELYTWYKDNKKWDIAISLLKEILSIDQKDIWARKELVDCYRGKFEGHSHLEDYIRSSNLSQNFRNVFEAINDFEKHIAFDVKSFVYHRAWGVGVIRKVDNDTLTINFGSKVGVKEMSLKMAVSALTPLAKNHIWVLKAKNYVMIKGEKVELAKKVKEDKEWTLKTIIKSFGNSCDFKKIKAELVPSILKDSEWTSWNTAAKKILESNSTFGVNPNDISQYIVREREISIEEKLANEFKAQKAFFARIDILMKYINREETDKTSELFAEMYNYFAAFVKTLDTSDSTSKVTEQIVASYLIVQTVTQRNKQLVNPSKVTFQTIYNRIENPREMYELLKDTKNTSLKADFLKNVKMLPNWADEFVLLFPTVLSGDMLKMLVNNNHTDKVQKLAVNCFENCRDFRHAVFYFFEHCQDEEWFKSCGISYERQLITLIQIIELAFREISNHVNSTENKKIIKTATELLFEKGALLKYMFENDVQTVNRMYTLINDLADFDPAYKAQLRAKIMEKYPDFDFHITEEKASQPKGMLVTAKKLEEKKNQLEKIQTVEIPENAREISEARAQGDLKENAEYKAAKEHQHWLNEQATKLQSEINRAVIFDPTTITTAMVSFATEVTLYNEDTKAEETYKILGPWESDPDNNVVSYMAPFGNAIMEKKVGEKASFTINDHKYNYTVKSIKALQL